jgi:hypothetical protein
MQTERKKTVDNMIESDEQWEKKEAPLSSDYWSKSLDDIQTIDLERVAKLSENEGFALLQKLLQKYLHDTVSSSVDVVETEQFNFIRHRIGATHLVISRLTSIPTKAARILSLRARKKTIDNAS